MLEPLNLDLVGVLGELEKRIYGSGFEVAENSAYGGVTGGHSKNSWHYAPGGRNAADLRDKRPDVAPEYEGGPNVYWLDRSKRIAGRAKEYGGFTEALGPGDPGHDTHIHLALKDKTLITPQWLDYIATGRYQDPSGQWLTTAPQKLGGGTSTGVTTAPTSGQPAPGSGMATSGAGGSFVPPTITRTPVEPLADYDRTPNAGVAALQAVMDRVQTEGWGKALGVTPHDYGSVIPRAAMSDAQLAAADASGSVIQEKRGALGGSVTVPAGALDPTSLLGPRRPLGGFAA